MESRSVDQPERTLLRKTVMPVRFVTLPLTSIMNQPQQLKVPMLPGEIQCVHKVVKGRRGREKPPCYYEVRVNPEADPRY